MGLTTTGPNITLDSTTIGWGAGLGLTTYARLDPGVVGINTHVYDSYYGLVVNSSYWTDERTAYNCSIGCRSNGFKYLVLQNSGQACQFAIYLLMAATMWPGNYQTNSPHCADPVNLGMPGDRNELGELIATFPAAQVGHTNAMWFQDPTFKDEATIAITPNLETNWA